LEEAYPFVNAIFLLVTHFDTLMIDMFSIHPGAGALMLCSC